MFPVMKTSPLIQQHHTAQVAVTSQPCMALINLHFLWLWGHLYSCHLIAFQPMQNPIDFLQQPHSKCTLTTCDDLDDEEEEEDFQTVSLEDDHWTTEEIPDRHLCIHEHSVPHELCPYPCLYLDYISSSYYDTLDLSDISKFEDLMTTSSYEDIPALDDIRYRSIWTMVSKWTFTFNFYLWKHFWLTYILLNNITVPCWMLLWLLWMVQVTLL